MFDFFQIVDFKKDLQKDCNYSFLNNPFYKKINCVENTKIFDSSYSVYLERNGSEENIYESGGKCIFIYGTVYTNKRYEKFHGEKPYKLNSEKLLQLVDEYGDGFTDFIKGSFVIIIFDTNIKSLRMVSDRLNVLPLYFGFKKEVLVISSSIRMILETGYVSKEINATALTEQMIFDYTLGSKTFFKDIERIENGMIYDFNASGLKKTSYWSVEQLYNDNLLPKKESLEMLSKTLYENTNLYSSDTEKLLLAVTGGFDGRANLAMLNKKKEDFLCYSYGMQGSQQVEVPKEICKRLNLNYEPVILNEEYESEHDECTLEAIEHSNATAPILRSNYPYAYKKLNSFAETIMTGLFGSEVMRPLHNLGIMMNDYSEKLFLSDNPESVLKEIKEDIKKKNYIKSEIIESSYEEIRDELFKNYFDKYEKYDKVYRFFFFIINEGVRKYFSQEIQIERVYVTTRFPFFDDDFVELMYKTPFAGMYNGFLGKSKFKRRKGQLLYAYIYRKFKPELGKIRLDRGYKPDDLLKPFPLNFISIYRGIKKTAAYKREKGNDTFNSEKWTENFISGSIYKTEDKMNVFGEGLKRKYEDKSYLKDLLKYSHIISLKKYFSTI
jgi:asparagine synthetase B (glutamine-hydrolysing)